MFENDFELSGNEDQSLVDTSTEQTDQQPKPFEIPDDALVSVKVDGEDKLLPWKEARSGVMFQSAFTRKTQELARQREEFENRQKEFGSRFQEYETRLGQLQSVLGNPQALAALYMHIASSQQQPQGPQPLTTEYLPKIEQTFEQKMQAALGQLRDQFSQERQAERYEQEMDSFMSGVLAKHPVLKAVEGIEDTIYGRVAALRPKSVEEAKELARTMVEGISQSITKSLEEQAKLDALTKAKAASGIEPRGGQPVFNRPPNVKRLEDLDQGFIDYLQQVDRASR